jgi:hypothetical protein
MLTAHTIIEARESSRSRSARPTPPSDISRPSHLSANAIREALRRVEGEYREMPGLSLTLPQAARLLGIEPSTCEVVVTALIERNILKRTLNGTYVRR